MTPLEAYAWMAWRPETAVQQQGFEDTETMPALPEWLRGRG